MNRLMAQQPNRDNDIKILVIEVRLAAFVWQLYAWGSRGYRDRWRMSAVL